MVDLNLWELLYDEPLVDTATREVSLEFGTHDTGYPFTRQVVIGAPGTAYADVPHPLGDGVVFGVDRTPGRRLTFAGAHLDHTPLPSTRQWTPRLDAAGVIAAAWENEYLRCTPGAVARLINHDRDRTVFGRPRGYTPTLDVVRKGWSEWAGFFDTTDDRFYGPERDQDVPVRVTGGAVTVGDIALIEPAGDRRSYPVIALDGEATNLVVQLYRGSLNPLHPHMTLVWSTGVTGAVEDARIDAQPWARSANDGDGTPLWGRLQGSSLDQARLLTAAEVESLPDEELYVAATCDDTAGVTVTMTWRDAFGSL